MSVSTAEEVLSKKFSELKSAFDVKDCMIAFAKMHVTAALEATNEKAIESDDLQGDCCSGRYHMKNSYPLENIK